MCHVIILSLILHIQHYSVILTDQILNRADLSNQTYKCFHGDSFVRLNQVNDKNCNCCDGSDEFYNGSAQCPNVCPIILTPTEKKQMKSIFIEGISAGKILKQKGKELYEKDLNNLTQAHFKTIELQKIFEDSKKKFKIADAKLHNWVYQKTEAQIPSEIDQRISRKKFISKSSKKDFSKPPEDQEQMEEEFYPTNTFSRIDFRDQINHQNYRKIKWETEQQNQFQNLLEKALSIERNEQNSQKTKYFHSGISKKLKSLLSENTQPEIYQNYLNAMEQSNKSENDYFNILSEVKRLNEVLMQDYGPNHEWYSSRGKLLECNIQPYSFFKTKNNRIFRPSKSAKLQLQLFVIVHVTDDYGAKTIFGFNQRGLTPYVEYGPGPPAIDDHPTSIRLKTICFPKEKLIDAMAISPSRIIGLLGMPQACPDSFSQITFECFLRDLQYYKDVLLNKHVDL